LSPYLGSSDVRVADLAKVRRNQLRQKKTIQKGLRLLGFEAAN